MPDTHPGSGLPEQFRKYWLTGAGGQAVSWGRDGDFSRCVQLINAKIEEHGGHPLPPNEINGLCATLHREATGATPGHAPGESAPRKAH